MSIILKPKLGGIRKKKMVKNIKAVSRVLNTNELLEAILKHIPSQELLESTRFVSKDWQALIETSPKLKWKTWQWKGTTIPPSILEDTDPSLLSTNGKKYGYEFAADAIYWVRKFWCMALTAPRDWDGEDGLSPDMCEWMISQLPDMELFRPRIGRIHITFELKWIIHGISLAIETPGASEVDVPDDEFTLKDFARIIYEKVLSSRGMGLFQYVWERTKNGRWVKKVQRRFELLVMVSTRVPRKLDSTEAGTDPVKYSVRAAFVFDLRNLELNSKRGLSVRVEYWLPGRVHPEACEKPPIFPGNAGDI
ncbi:hypothetical protein TWF106_009935 [Orbilia oligospora]|uniref:F-box domain-containing protein n=1 Tax=Orbilia oligospora TaxID=2813651 RepID=A0A6G1M9Z0_ORBOL|nr:hypothetical protein TWF106_009935 [Orbilia oligospora]KAF3250001.1 hypothetical protein TWF192_005495 [Orbilia oligospora]